MPESLMKIIDNQLPNEGKIGAEEIYSILESIDISKEGLPRDIQQTIEGILTEHFNQSGELNFDSQGWKIDVKAQLAKATISAAILWGILIASGATAAIPLTIISAIVPCLFDIEKVTLTRKEDEIVTELIRNTDMLEGTPDQLYERLPKKIKDQLNNLDFLDFLDKLVEAGRANTEEKEFEILPKLKKRFRITLK